jgi:hypothetical protein
LLEKICSALKKSLLNESLKEEEELLIHSKPANNTSSNNNNKDVHADHQHKGKKPPAKNSKALNTTSTNIHENHPLPKSINKPAGLTQIDFDSNKTQGNDERSLLQKEMEQLRKDLAGMHKNS